MSALELHCELTDIIIELLEQGIPPSRALWHLQPGGFTPTPRRSNGEYYRGGNYLKLALLAARRGFQSCFWFTLIQAEQLGAEVRRAELGTNVLYCGKREHFVTKADGSRTKTTRFFERSYRVFNADQLRGLPLKYHAAFQSRRNECHGEILANRFFQAIGAKVRHGGNRALYDPNTDIIEMPYREAFIDDESYQSVFGHEHMHWTGHASRLNRLTAARFGDAAYAREELIAEIGAAFICIQLGITPAIREDRISYLGHWLTILQSDKRAIYSAASRASDAVEFLQSFQPAGITAAYLARVSS